MQQGLISSPISGVLSHNSPNWMESVFSSLMQDYKLPNRNRNLYSSLVKYSKLGPMRWLSGLSATKSDDLSSIPKIQSRGEKNRLPKMFYDLHVYVIAWVHPIPTQIKINVKKKIKVDLKIFS